MWTGGLLCPAPLHGSPWGQPVSFHAAFCCLELGGMRGDDLPAKSLDEHPQEKVNFV